MTFSQKANDIREQTFEEIEFLVDDLFINLESNDGGDLYEYIKNGIITIDEMKEYFGKYVTKLMKDY